MKQTRSAESTGRAELTLGELRAFLSQIADAPDDAKVKARVGFLGAVRELKIEYETGERAGE